MKSCTHVMNQSFSWKQGIAWSKKGTPAAVAVFTTKANPTSILGAISATDSINIRVRVPKRIKKRKLFGPEHNGCSVGAVAGYCLSFLKVTLGEMDKYRKMKESIFTLEDIDMFILLRALLRQIRLSSSDQLLRVKLSKINSWKKQALMARVSKACDSLFSSDFNSFASPSVKCFGRYLNRERS